MYACVQYEVPRNELNDRVLRLTVCNGGDRFSMMSNRILGQLNITLDRRVFVDPLPHWHSLEQPKK